MGIRKQIKRFLFQDEGSAALEYGMIAGLVTMAVVPALEAMGQETSQLYFSIAQEINGVAKSIGIR